MTDFKISRLDESEMSTVKLDNEDVSVSDFNKTLESLRPGQRILETSDRNFHIVERLRG